MNPENEKKFNEWVNDQHSGYRSLLFENRDSLMLGHNTSCLDGLVTKEHPLVIMHGENECVNEMQHYILAMMIKKSCPEIKRHRRDMAEKVCRNMLIAVRSDEKIFEFNHNEKGHVIKSTDNEVQVLACFIDPKPKSGTIKIVHRGSLLSFSRDEDRYCLVDARQVARYDVRPGNDLETVMELEIGWMKKAGQTGLIHKLDIADSPVYWADYFLFLHQWMHNEIKAGLGELTSIRQFIPEWLRLFQSVSRFAARIHKAGVVHRDLKAANIVILASDQEVIALDYGLAGLVTDTENTRAYVTTLGIGGVRGLMNLVFHNFGYLNEDKSYIKKQLRDYATLLSIIHRIKSGSADEIVERLRHDFHHGHADEIRRVFSEEDCSTDATFEQISKGLFISEERLIELKGYINRDDPKEKMWQLLATINYLHRGKDKNIQRLRSACRRTSGSAGVVVACAMGLADALRPALTLLDLVESTLVGYVMTNADLVAIGATFLFIVDLVQHKRKRREVSSLDDDGIQQRLANAGQFAVTLCDSGGLERERVFRHLQYGDHVINEEGEFILDPKRVNAASHIQSFWREHRSLQQEKKQAAFYQWVRCHNVSRLFSKIIAQDIDWSGGGKQEIRITGDHRY